MTHWFSCPCTVLKPSILPGQDSKGQREEKNLFSPLYLQAKLRNKFYVWRDDLFKPCLREYDCIKKGKKYFVSLSHITCSHWPSCKIWTLQPWPRRVQRTRDGCRGPQKLRILFIGLRVISPSCPKMAQMILSVHLSFLRASCHCSFAKDAILPCWRAPCDMTLLPPTSWPSFFPQMEQARLTHSSGSAREPSSGTHLTRPLTHCAGVQQRVPPPASHPLLPLSCASRGPHSKPPPCPQNPSPFLAVTGRDFWVTEREASLWGNLLRHRRGLRMQPISHVQYFLSV